MANIDTTPMMSLSMFVIGFIALLLLARASIEVYDIIKARQTRQRLTGTNKAVQRYYNEYSNENKGA